MFEWHSRNFMFRRQSNFELSDRLGCCSFFFFKNAGFAAFEMAPFFTLLVKSWIWFLNGEKDLVSWASSVKQGPVFSVCSYVEWLKYLGAKSYYGNEVFDKRSPRSLSKGTEKRLKATVIKQSFPNGWKRFCRASISSLNFVHLGLSLFCCVVLGGLLLENLELFFHGWKFLVGLDFWWHPVQHNVVSLLFGTIFLTWGLNTACSWGQSEFNKPWFIYL